MLPGSKTVAVLGLSIASILCQLCNIDNSTRIFGVGEQRPNGDNKCGPSVLHDNDSILRCAVNVNRQRD